MNKILLSTLLILLCVFAIFAQESRLLNILEKPNPRLNAEQIEAQGTITLKVQFLSNGQIGQVNVVSGLPLGLTENAVGAAKKIKFEPAIKNNSAITVIKSVQYNFYYGWTNDPTKFNNKNDNSKLDVKAEEILKKAVQFVGGDKYLQAQTQIGRGRYAQMQGGAVVSFQSFVDAVVFPDKERTEFKAASGKIVQTNTGKTGWIFDGGSQTIKDQSAAQIEDYKRGLRVSLDSFLRGAWRGEGVLSYIGKRAGTLGKRNDVLKLVFPDEYAVEFEIADDGTPVKALYTRKNSDGTETKEEDRYAQFADIAGIKTPFIIDRFTDNAQTSRINYESVEFNKNISDSIFAKPKNAKDAKKDAKF